MLRKASPQQWQAIVQKVVSSVCTERVTPVVTYCCSTLCILPSFTFHNILRERICSARADCDESTDHSADCRLWHASQRSLIGISWLPILQPAPDQSTSQEGRAHLLL